VTVAADLERGREAYARLAWQDAHGALTAADGIAPLGGDDLELLATSAYMLGREAEFLELMMRAHRAHVESGDATATFRCALWVGITLARRGDMGQATGWLSRAERVLDRVDPASVGRGYLMLPLAFEQEAGGDWEAAAATLAEAVELGAQAGEHDLFALAAHEQGHILIIAGRIQEGLALLDEAMVAVVAGELSPIVSGIVYCGVILACQDAHQVARAREWTAALSRWCERQPDLVAFSGRCLIHRAEIMQLGGAWPEALEEARRAGKRCVEGGNPDAAGEAAYRQGEIRRVLGEDAAAEECYRDASRQGREPYPGLALLRLAQGRLDAAEAAIRRVEAEISAPGLRVALLRAYVEIMLAVDDRAAARAACDELDGLAEADGEGALVAIAAQARGALELAEGDARRAAAALRRAGEMWRQLDAPYELARTRALAARACRALGDDESAALELDAARTGFERLGARPDLERLDPLAASGGSRHGLTARELQVLRHIATGDTNKAIAAELVLSVRTIDRHVSNIFTKLGVSTRAAAVARAHELGLL